MAEHRAQKALMSAPKELPASWTGLFLRPLALYLDSLDLMTLNEFYLGLGLVDAVETLPFNATQEAQNLGGPTC